MLPTNPIDVSAVSAPEDFGTLLTATASEPTYAAVLATFDPEELAAIATGWPDPPENQPAGEA